MIEKFIETEGLNKGRVKDIAIAMELAYTEDAWRDENGGKPFRIYDPKITIIFNKLRTVDTCFMFL